ncbi:V4R domain-containing protein [Alteribacillus persepolensis]|uniref:V4R domain-containing protein n=1 Tax=Alteribacillus persepolensis TaxID=568899 RepID=A0A1G8A358_9BACI|nr:XylR N-terminal domain-containing protein [Alteribacillus persepolensis]SDH15301.1 V4R domain-containing protein [Alteribacillus persepolensis]
MRANQLLFDNLMDINPRTGMITFNHKRMALVSVEALGLLRRDLINTLGMDRAKGFLMRYGWAWGAKDGESIASMYDWDNTKELMLAGPVLHTLEGVVTVEPETLDTSHDSLHFTGFWRSSFEAVEHVNHYGESTCPVCWILAGYASGYLTKTFGSDVIAYEDQCAGQGANYCYFVAKTTNLLDDKHKKDMRYYKAESLASELDRAYNELHEINQNIIESDKIQDQLTNLFLEDRDFTETIEFVAQSLKKSIIVDYHGQTIESVFLSDDDHRIYTNWNDQFVYTEETENVITTYPIRANNLNLGRMVVIGHDPIENKDHLIIKRALSVFTIQLFHQWKITRSIWKKKEEFFEEMLNDTDNAVYEKRSHLFHFRPDSLNRILSMKLEPADCDKHVMQFLSATYPDKDIFAKGHYIIMILSDDDKKATKDFAQCMADDLEHQFPHVTIYMGVGRQSSSLQDLTKSYQDACAISDFVQLTQPANSRLTFFEDIEPVMMLLKGTDQQELIDFYHKTIGALVKYDENSQSNLLLTLKAYLDNNGNLQQTADEMHLSIAGLRYRLERIEQLCDVDLKSGQGRFQYQLAIQIYFAIQINDSQPSATSL